MKHASRLAFAVIALVGLSLSGCQIVASPMAGVIYNETKYGNTATDEAGASKEGKACGQSILGWVATGDASIKTAAANGGIKNIKYVDYDAKNILGIYGEYTTTVYGD